MKGLFRDLWHNSDEADYELGRAVLAGEHAWLEAGAIGLGLSADDLRPRLPGSGKTRRSGSLRRPRWRDRQRAGAVSSARSAAKARTSSGEVSQEHMRRAPPQPMKS